MPLSSGFRVGQYQILAPLGAGGMGEVYRARDTRLDREVAIKVLPDAFASDPDRLSRFEREARAVAALSHPGILSIHDFGTTADGLTYAVMELLEGTTLRERLDTGALPPRRAIDIAAQIIRALGAAHEKGIVHRDVKPENIFVAADGRVRVLDFGLARMTPSDGSPLAGATRTTAGTSEGVVMGTVGYMSPEQVRGATADHRSDIFSFGVVLYEMLTGRRPFGGDSAVETMNAILKEDPPPLALNDPLTPGLRRIVDHCLEKSPGERFQSAADLAFSLEAVRTGSDLGVQTALAAPPARKPVAAVALMTLSALGVGLLGGYFLPHSRTEEVSAAPSFTRLTYDKGTIWNGRFAPDGRSVLYGAAWDGGPIRVWLSGADQAGSTPLNLPDASLLSVSKTGELAISLGHAFAGWMGEGTLARVPMLGGAPRPIAENVREADWTPDGTDLAIVRRVEGRERLEFPIGKKLYETNGYISHIRFSPDGSRIAFADHPLYADDNGDVAVVDRDGRKTTLATGFSGLRGVSWSPDGAEVWFTAHNYPKAGIILQAASLEGRARTVLSLPTDWRIFDIAKDGRLLIGSELAVRHVELTRAGQPVPQDLSMFEQSFGTSISPDGAVIAITDQGSFSGSSYATYARRPGQSAAVRLGEGQAVGFTPDMRSVVSIVYGPPSRILLLPVGTGQARELPNSAKLTIQIAAAMPDGKRMALVGAIGTGALRGYIQDIAGGTIHPFTPAGVDASVYPTWPVSPDGQYVVLIGTDGRSYLYPTADGNPTLLPTIERAEYPLAWTPDGRGLYVESFSGVPDRVFLIDVSSGRRTFWKELHPSQKAGVRLSQVLITPDGGTFLHSYSRLLSNLYVASGIPTKAR